MPPTLTIRQEEAGGGEEADVSAAGTRGDDVIILPSKSRDDTEMTHFTPLHHYVSLLRLQISCHQPIRAQSLCADVMQVARSGKHLHACVSMSY